MTGRNLIVKARYISGRQHSTGLLTVPAEMMRAIPDGARFRPEWHEDGILFRFVAVHEAVINDDLPPWVSKT